MLYDVELFTVTPTLIENFERCQQWFIKNLFFVPKFTPKHLLMKLSELNSVESEIALRNFLFLGRLIPETKMAPVVRKLFDSRTKTFFDTSIDSLGVLPSICDALKKYGLFSYFDQWFIDSFFPTYFTWKIIVYRKIREFEANGWDTFITDHPDLYIVQACLENTPPRKFWSISKQFPDLVCCLHRKCFLESHGASNSCNLSARILWIFPVSAAIKWVITVMVEISKGKGRHPSSKSVL